MGGWVLCLEVLNLGLSTPPAPPLGGIRQHRALCRCPADKEVQVSSQLYWPVLISIPIIDLNKYQ